MSPASSAPPSPAGGQPSAGSSRSRRSPAEGAWAPSADVLSDALQRGYRYALSLTHDRERAADLVQDACVGISRRGGPWELPYLLRAIRNRHIDLHRRRGLRLVSLEDGGTGPATSIGAPIADGDPRLERALGGLRTRQREVLYLSAVEGWTAAEIADLTGRPRATVLSVLARTKSRLRTALGEDGRRREGAPVGEGP